MIHLDTHVVVWIASGSIEKVTTTVLDRIESEDVVVSPMVRLELTYLHEIGRLRGEADEILTELGRALGLRDDTTAFAEVVDEAGRQSWTRDPFDRIIAGQAVAARCRLATADRRIAAALPDVVVWDH